MASGEVEGGLGVGIVRLCDSACIDFWLDGLLRVASMSMQSSISNAGVSLQHGHVRPGQCHAFSTISRVVIRRSRQSSVGDG